MTPLKHFLRTNRRDFVLWRGLRQTNFAGVVVGGKQQRSMLKQQSGVRNLPDLLVAVVASAMGLTSRTLSTDMGSDLAMMLPFRADFDQERAGKQLSRRGQISATEVQ